MDTTHFETSNVAANESSAMVEGVRNEANTRGLFTTRRLGSSRQKKRLFFGAFATVFVAVVSVLIFYGCQKDTVSQDGNSMNGKMMMSTGDDYPFVLPAAIAPYQYAVYEDDIEWLFDYMLSVFDAYVEGDERGYFTLSYNADNTLIYYGFITTTSVYYDPNVFVDDPDNPFINIDDIDDDDYDMMYACKPEKHITTKSEKRAERWSTRQGKEKNGYEVKVTLLDNGWIRCVASKNCG